MGDEERIALRRRGPKNKKKKEEPPAPHTASAPADEAAGGAASPSSAPAAGGSRDAGGFLSAEEVDGAAAKLTPPLPSRSWAGSGGGDTRSEAMRSGAYTFSCAPWWPPRPGAIVIMGPAGGGWGSRGPRSLWPHKKQRRGWGPRPADCPARPWLRPSQQ